MRPHLEGLLLLLLLAGMTVAGDAGPELDRQVPPPGAEATSSADPFSPPSLQFDFASGLYARRLYREAASEYETFLKTFPNDPRRTEAVLNLAHSRFRLGEYAAAEALFLQFLRLAPGHAQALDAKVRLGCCRFERKAYAEAIPLLREAAAQKAAPKLLQTARYYLGRSLQETGAMAEAATVLAGALAVNSPLQPLARYALAEAMGALGKHAEAQSHLKTFLEAYPQHRLASAARLRLAESWRTTGKLDEAAKIYETMLDAEPAANHSRHEALLGLGWVRLKQARWKDAEAAARKALEGTKGPLKDSLHYLLGLALLKQKQYRPAATTLAEVQRGPHVAAALLQQIWALLGAAQLDQAAAQAQAYLKRFPKREIGTAHYLLGTALFRKADYAGAAKAYAVSRSLAKHPYQAEAGFQTALCHERLGQDADAAAAYAYYLKTFPKNTMRPAALLGLGNAEARLGKFAEAAQAYAQVGALQSASAAQKEQALLQQAVCWYERKEYDKMDASYRKVLDQFPHSAAAPEALYWVAWGAQRRQQYADAIKLYNRLITEHPKHSLVDRCQYRLGMSHYQAGDEAAAAAVFYEILLNRPQIEIGQTELLWLGSYFLQHDQPVEADTTYKALLERHPGPEVYTLTLYYRAEAQRRVALRTNREEDWQRAAESFRQLSEKKDPRYRSLSHFGLGQCYRRLGKLEDAFKSLKLVQLAPDDPLMASLHLEIGLVEKARGRLPQALQSLMRVGLLYDDMDVCGEALYEAGRVSERLADLDKARTCYAELSSTAAGTSGARHGQSSPWSKKARKRLKQLEAQAEKEKGPKKAPPKDIAADDKGEVF